MSNNITSEDKIYALERTLYNIYKDKDYKVFCCKRLVKLSDRYVREVYFEASFSPSKVSSDRSPDELKAQKTADVLNSMKLKQRVELAPPRKNIGRNAALYEKLIRKERWDELRDALTNEREDGFERVKERLTCISRIWKRRRLKWTTK